MKASEAKELAQSRENTANKAELNGIYGKIRKAAESGNFSISVTTLGKSVKSFLETDGYTVNHHFDSRDGDSTYTISW